MGPIITALLPGIADMGGKLIDRLFPDAEAAAKAKLELFKMQQTGELAKLASDTDIIKAGAAIVEAEAKSESWLTRSWRPTVMLVFTMLIVARWFGWSASGMSEAEAIKLWDIVELGLGGYVIGRSVTQTVEAIAPVVAGALKK